MQTKCTQLRFSGTSTGPDSSHCSWENADNIEDRMFAISTIVSRADDNWVIPNELVRHILMEQQYYGEETNLSQMKLGQT